MLSMFPALSYLSELLRGLAGLLFEQAGEVLGVLETGYDRYQSLVILYVNMSLCLFYISFSAHRPYRF